MVGDLLPPLGLKILLAEDNSVNAMVAELILGSFGCHCVRAENGLLAIEEFQRQRFDGVLMDCQMPVMDGYEATRRIRQWEADSSEGRARCWIIAVTANAFDEERGRCLEAGMDDYLSKPFEKRRLYQLLRNCVPGRIPMNQ
jgi:CheY-like chemotaxis protein